MSLTYQEYAKRLESIELKPGAEDFIQEVRGSGIKTALATSTDWWIVEKLFDNLKIENLFDSVTTGEEVLNKKPAPDSFLTAAEKLGAFSDECLVIEDSPSGVEAAKAAEMKVIAIDETDEKEGLGNANLVVGGFEEITPKILLEL